MPILSIVLKIPVYSFPRVVTQIDGQSPFGGTAMYFLPWCGRFLSPRDPFIYSVLYLKIVLGLGTKQGIMTFITATALSLLFL